MGMPMASSYLLNKPHVEMISSEFEVQDFTTVMYGYQDGFYTSAANDPGKHILDNL